MLAVEDLLDLLPDKALLKNMKQHMAMSLDKYEREAAVYKD